MRTNLSAMFYLCKAAVPLMRPRQCYHQRQELHPVEITDPRAPRLRDDERGDRQLHRGSGRDACGEGDSGVNAVAPGPIWTPLIPSTLPVEKVENFGSDTPLGRVGQPAELRRRLCPPGVRRGQLHLGRRHPGNRRKTNAVRACAAKAGSRPLSALRFFHAGRTLQPCANRGEHEPDRPTFADQSVGARPALQHVVARAAVKRILA